MHLQGMRFKKLYTQLGEMYISLLVQFIHDTDTDIDRLFQTILEALTIILGIQICPFTMNYEKYNQCTTASWIEHLWNFCFNRGVILKSNEKYFPGRRANDRNLMQCFIDNGFHSEQLTTINRCRLYLQVVTLSDISTGDGYYIDKSC